MQTSSIDASTKHNEKIMLDGACYAKMDQVWTRDADGLPKERGPITGCGCMKHVNRCNNHMVRNIYVKQMSNKAMHGMPRYLKACEKQDA